MRINVFTNFFLIIIVLGLGLLIALSSQVLATLDDIIKAERQKHNSLQLANELFQSSEDLTKMARSYVTTGDSNYERFFFEILDIRNGTRPRPMNYFNNYWVVNSLMTHQELGGPISLADLMRREGFSEQELDLLQQSQNISDTLVNLEKQAFAAMRGLYDDGNGNFTVSRAPDRDFAMDLLFGERYKAEKAKIMLPIAEFMQVLEHRTQTRLRNLQAKFQQQMILILALLCIGLFIAVCAAFYMRRNILHPLDYLRRQTSSIAHGSYSARCDISTHNEIAKLGADFNTMAEAIECEITKLKRVEGSLRERLKEIRCFYAIRRGMESSSLEEICKTIFVQLTAAMQFPDIATIKIELDGKQFVSDQIDKDHTRALRKQITVYGEAYGWIAIFYNEDHPFLLPEEQSLIDVVGDDLGKWLERKQAEALILAEQELRVRDAATREFAAHVEHMREEDRKYIAREIHDELGQLLAALHLEISLLKDGQVNKNEKLEIIRHNMSELVDRAGQSVRNVAEHLRPASLEFGITSAIRKLTNEFSKHSGLSCTLQLTEAAIDLDENQTVTIFRIVQESLTNVARHAEASCVRIALSQSADHFIVEVRDNGKGFCGNAPKKKSFGLLGMRERAAVLGGRIDITSAPQQGTVVSMRIPMKRNKNGI